MDLTQGTLEEKHNRSKKMMLWFGMAALFMSFAGWISALIIRSNEKDWAKDLQLPDTFITSIAILIVSSITFYLARKGLKKNNSSQVTVWLVITLLLGIGFIINQFIGFNKIMETGHHFTGEISDPKSSFIYLLTTVHIVHVVAGLICVLVVIYNHFKQRYNATNMLGLELAETFWHFLAFLWIFIFLFLYFRN